MKKIFSVILAIVMLLVMCSCAEDEIIYPQKALPDYPEISEVDGYVVSGKVTDLQSNGLKNARITVNGEIMAITDDDGAFTIKSLTGTNKIGVTFGGYVFKRTEYTVNNNSTDILFEGASDFAVTASSHTTNDAKLFGVIYTIGDQRKTENSLGNAYALNNKGKTTITPYKEGFTFYPSSVSVYSAGHTDFTAVPNEDTYSVSGTITFPTSSSLPEVFVYVNSVKYTQSVVVVSGNEKKAVYTIYGIKDDGVSKIITVGSGLEGYKSKNPIVVSSERTDANFEMMKCRSISVNLVFSPGEAPTGAYDYYVTIKNEKNEVVEGGEKQKVSNRLTSGSYDVWAGCRIIVESADFYGEEKITESFLDYNNTEIDIKVKRS